MEKDADKGEDDTGHTEEGIRQRESPIPIRGHEFLNSEEVRRKMEELMEAQRDELTLRR